MRTIYQPVENWTAGPYTKTIKIKWVVNVKKVFLIFHRLTIIIHQIFVYWGPKFGDK